MRPPSASAQSVTLARRRQFSKQDVLEERLATLRVRARGGVDDGSSDETQFWVDEEERGSLHTTADDHGGEETEQYLMPDFESACARTPRYAMPEPRFLVAAGACAISGGLYDDAAAVDRSFLQEVGPVLYVPGCPPHPLTFINAILDLLGAG